MINKYHPHLMIIFLAFMMHAPVWSGWVDFYSGDGSDLIPYIYGVKLFLYQTFQSLAEIPLWNPYLLFGQPIVGNIQYALFYPLNMLFLFIPFFNALWLHHVTHMIIAGLGTYWLARHTGGGKNGSMIAGCLYMINGRVLYYINAGWVEHFAAICWLPLLLLTSLFVLKKKALYFPVLLAMVLTMSFLAGTPQYTLLACFLFFIQGITQFFLYPSTEERMSLIFRILLTGLLFTLLVSIQLFPTFEQTYLSSRVFFADAAHGFHFRWDLKQWFRILFRPELLTHDFSWELCAYIGIGGMVLAFFGLADFRKQWPLILIWGVIPWLVSMGPAFPPSAFVMKTVPGLSILSSSSRYLIFTILILCVSAGNGLEKLSLGYGSGQKKTLWFFISAGACLFAAGILIPQYDRASVMVSMRFWGAMVIFFLLTALYLRRGTIILRILLMGWLMVDPILLSVNILKGEYRIRDLQVPTKIVQALKNHPRPVRIAAIQLEHLRDHLLTPFDDRLCISYGISRAGGYEPLAMLRTLQFLTKMDGTGSIHDAMWGFRLWSFARPDLYNIAGVTHVVTYEPIENRQLKFVARDTITMPHFHGGWWKEQPIYLYENMGALPRAFLLPQHSEGPAIPIDVSRISPDHVRLSFRTDQPGTAVISESFHPGWTATAREASVQLHPFLDTFISFKVKAGEHDVGLDFSPQSFRLGRLLTLIGLLLSLLILLYHRIWVRRGTMK